MNRMCKLLLWVWIFVAPMSAYAQSVQEPENPFASDRDRAIQRIANSQAEQAELQRQQLELQRQQLEQQQQVGQQSPQSSGAFWPNTPSPPQRDYAEDARQSNADLNAAINSARQQDRAVIESGNRVNVADALGKALDAEERRKAAQAQNSVSNVPAVNYEAAAAAAAAAAASAAANSTSPPTVNPYTTPVTPNYSTQGASTDVILYLIIGFLTLALLATLAYASRNQKSDSGSGESTQS